jgi:signal transduction histidine kinase
VLNVVVGAALFSIDDLVLHIEPVPSLADALYLPGYPVLAAGLALLALSRSAGRDVAGVIDGAIIAIGFGLLLTYQRLTGADIQVAAIADAWAVLFVLVMTRMAGLVRGIERSEAARRHLLDQTMHAAEQERTQIAAELHDGPIRRLSVLSYDLERARQRVLANPVAVARLEHAQAALSSEVQGLRELMASLRPRPWTRSAPSPATRGSSARCGSSSPAGSTASWRRSSTGSPRRPCST